MLTEGHLAAKVCYAEIQTHNTESVVFEQNMNLCVIQKTLKVLVENVPRLNVVPILRQNKNSKQMPDIVVSSRDKTGMHPYMLN